MCLGEPDDELRELREEVVAVQLYAESLPSWLALTIKAVPAM